MAKKKTPVDLVFALPNAISSAILEAMTPTQKQQLSPTQAGRILTVATEAANSIAAILQNDQSAGDVSGN